MYEGQGKKIVAHQEEPDTDIAGADDEDDYDDEDDDDDYEDDIDYDDEEEDLPSIIEPDAEPK